MTDKIMIDGVNVSGCYDYQKATGICRTGFRVDEIPYCECFTCNYKRWQKAEQQLQAEQQKSEALQQSENEAKEIIAEMKQKVKDLEEDIQGLKTNLLEKENCSARSYLIVTYRENVEQLKKFINIRNERNNYKQALEEIKEICLNCKANNISLYQQVLQKCEVLDE